MEHSELTQLISSLEYGTKLHISVVFPGRYGNEKTALPQTQQFHTCPVCDLAKGTPEGFAECFRCRNTVLKRCIRRKRSFGGFCVKGVYEYCRPVVRDGEVLAVVFVGNILTQSPRQRAMLEGRFDPSLLRTMQADFSEQDCIRTADLMESYIRFLLDKYGDSPRQPADALIENIKSYIAENLLYDFSMAELSAVFNYNEKYLGRLFKAKTGRSVKAYCNAAKIEKAKGLLKYSRMPISDVAAHAGFNNVTYFNRVFRELTGLSPQEYR